MQGVDVFVQGLDVDEAMGEIKVNASPERDGLLEKNTLHCFRTKKWRVKNSAMPTVAMAMCTVQGLKLGFRMANGRFVTRVQPTVRAMFAGLENKSLSAI